MTKYLKFCFEIWWRPLLFWVLISLILGISEFFRIISFETFVLIIIGLGLFLTLITSIYQFAKRKWLIGFLSLGIYGVTMFLFSVFSFAMYITKLKGADNFAENLKIPSNIPINIPVNLYFDKQRPDSLANKVMNSTDFQLYNSFQPGLYEYDFWIGKIEKGTIYLKVFEITQEYALSANNLPQTSSIKIYNPTDSVMKFGTSSHFTIYEGEWGQPYAARFEIWYKPDNGWKKRKLFSKNYIIEGWMR